MDIIIDVYYAVAGVSYSVVKRNDNHYQIFKCEKCSFKNEDRRVYITHRETLKSAKKVANLLASAYKEGFSHGSY